VKVDAGKLVRITFNNHSCHSGEVSWDWCCTGFHYENVFRLYLLKEPSVCINIRYQWLESDWDIVRFLHLMRPDQPRGLCPILIFILVVARRGDQQAWISTRAPLQGTSLAYHSFILFPQHQFVFRHVLYVEGNFSNAVDNLFKENLKDRVRASILSAELSRLLDQIVILSSKSVFLRYQTRSSIRVKTSRLSSLWVLERLGRLLKTRLTCTELYCLVSLLLANQFVDVTHNVVNVIVKFFGKSDELLRKLTWQIQSALVLKIIKIFLRNLCL